MIKIDLIETANSFADQARKTVVVIDVLRATSTIVTSLSNGCTSITPVKTPEQALKLKKQNPNFLVGGERGGQKLPGFDFGNSPLEYESERVRGREVILTTTNGTQALANTTDASCVFVGCFLNLNAVVDKVLQAEDDVQFKCAGTDGQFSIDDTLAAALMIKSIHQEDLHSQLSDSASWALHALDSIFDTPQKLDVHNIENILVQSSHGKRLIKLGFRGDISYCSQLNLFEIVPQLTNGKLIK